MTNKEMLEYAAKAAGIEGLNFDRVQRDWAWNPLTDDGAALRLAVKLHLPVEAMIAFVAEREPDWHKDPYAATRRAIVRAAAEIGRQMP